MRTTTGSVHGNPSKPPSSTLPTSVPLYVYRELATELKATQAQLDALNAKNRQLAQENQRLRHEITQVVQSFLHLQKLVDYQTTPSSYSSPTSHPEVNVPKNYQSTQTQPRPQAHRSRQPVVPEPPNSKSRHPDFSVPLVEISSPMPETVLVEEQEVGYYPTAKSQAKELNGWWLALGILLIMLTAFGAGYLIVRPLFAHQSR
ncbi:hypothetical protein Nos7524_5299 [Nostoc sp. PCC 7524]|uniref:hypothetical protein n=1 Tax=Nostoc sp. (strain ATCC 29411 / PCC 7524) TaxID=28072 RepID=UPI00029EEC0D|nr:hypothetical protein [Nostoc sp. PCC 7524]AFY51022.1 hypothetical protein Nos7524_5299 [Nostoc sp. PCC 7524]